MCYKFHSLEEDLPAIDSNCLEKHIVTQGENKSGEIYALSEGAHNDGLGLFAPEVGSTRLLESVSAGDQHVDHEVGAVVLLRHLPPGDGRRGQHGQHHHLHSHPPPVVVPEHSNHYHVPDQIDQLTC